MDLMGQISHWIIDKPVTHSLLLLRLATSAGCSFDILFSCRCTRGSLFVAGAALFKLSGE